MRLFNTSGWVLPANDGNAMNHIWPPDPSNISWVGFWWGGAIEYLLCMHVKDFFSTSGPIAKRLANFEPRPEQLEMAAAVERGFGAA